MSHTPPMNMMSVDNVNDRLSQLGLASDFAMTDNDLQALSLQSLSLPINSQTLKRFLPHRYPFVMLDRVVALRAGLNIVGYKNVSNNENFFNGHFPNQPLMPGVLMVEAMAQIAGVLGFVSDGKNLSDGMVYLFAGVDNVRFKRQVVPGDRLWLTATLSTQKRQVSKYQAQALVDGQMAASAEITLIKQPSTQDNSF